MLGIHKRLLILGYRCRFVNRTPQGNQLYRHDWRYEPVQTQYVNNRHEVPAVLRECTHEIGCIFPFVLWWKSPSNECTGSQQQDFIALHYNWFERNSCCSENNKDFNSNLTMMISYTYVFDMFSAWIQFQLESSSLKWFTIWLDTSFEHM